MVHHIAGKENLGSSSRPRPYWLHIWAIHPTRFGVALGKAAIWGHLVQVFIHLLNMCMELDYIGVIMTESCKAIGESTEMFIGTSRPVLERDDIRQQENGCDA